MAGAPIILPAEESLVSAAKCRMGILAAWMSASGWENPRVTPPKLKRPP